MSSTSAWPSACWSKRVLIHQVENQTYEATFLSQTNFEETLPEPLHHQARLAIKDAYTFDFLELGDEHSEKQLEAAILARVKPFLREMGGMFTFVGSQFRLEVSGREYFIDLVLFHLGESNNPIGVASYRVVRRLPENLKGQLPEPEQIARLLDGLD